MPVSLVAVLPAPPARKTVLLLSAGTFALGTDAFVISGILPEVQRDLRVSAAAAGLLIAVFSASYALSAPVLAVITSRIERRRLLLFSLGVFILANVVAALAPAYWLLMIARVVAALAAASFTPAANAVAAGVAKPEERGRALATVLGGLTLASALGVPLGTLVGSLSSWRLSFVLVAVLGIAALLGLAVTLKPLAITEVVSLRERIGAVALPGVRTALLVTVLAVSGVFVMYTYLAWFVGRVSGVAGALITVVYLVYGVAAVISNLFGGWLVDRYPAARVAAASIGLMAAVFFALAILTAVVPSGALPIGILLAMVALWSLVGWWFNPAQNKRLLEFAGTAGPIVLSLSASAIYAGQALGGVIGAGLLRGGPSLIALVAALCATASLTVLLVTTVRRRDSAADRITRSG